jgi:hypothetical protein
MLCHDPTISAAQTCSVSFDSQLSQQIGFFHAHLHENGRGMFLTEMVRTYYILRFATGKEDCDILVIKP